MAKPWHPLEQNFMSHPKFLVLSAGAICLWLEGKNYCDVHLTDGLIPRDALRTFRFNHRARVEELKAVVEGYNGPLWEEHAVGFKMHDYLNHNDCREAVLDRIAKADEAREEKRAYLKAYREQQKATRTTRELGSNPVRAEFENSSEPDKQKQKQKHLSPADQPPTPTEDRVAAFYQWFAVEYKAQRHSDYLVPFKADTPIIWKLLQSVPMERLKLLATLMLTEKIADDWIQQSDRSIKILKIKLNWLNERLSAWEATRANGTQG